MDRSDTPVTPAGWALPALAGGLALACMSALGGRFFDDFALDFGSVLVPHPRYANFLSHWLVWGSAAAFGFTLALSRFAATAEGDAALRRLWNRLDDKAFMAFAALAAFVLPLAIHHGVLQGAPLTDDEGCYLFSARLVASGRLWSASHPMRDFFQHDFMVNDGRSFSQYFLGWPALLAPGVLIGHPEVVNPLLAGLTVPALMLTAQRIAGATWARLAAVIAVTSPSLLIAPATLMSHTSCLCALAWLAWATLRSRDDDAPRWTHAAVGALFGAAFFIRPTSAFGVGAPLVAWWALGVMKREGAARARAAAAFAVPAALLGATFLLVNKSLTGSFGTTAYQYAARLIRDSGTHLSVVWTGNQRRYLDAAVAHFAFDRGPRDVLAWLALGLYRFQAAVFGWPCAWILLPFAPRGALRRVLAAGFALFCLVHMFALDPGVDFFGPHHYFELALPMVLLTVAGGAALHRWARGLAVDRADTPSLRALGAAPVALVLVMAALSVGVHVPRRLATLAMAADDARKPVEMVERAGIHNAVIFAQVPFHPGPQCEPRRPHYLVQWRPLHDPDLRDDVLWVNHRDPERDRALLATMPGRRGFVFFWQDGCTPSLAQLP